MGPPLAATDAAVPAPAGASVPGGLVENEGHTAAVVTGNLLPPGEPSASDLGSSGKTVATSSLCSPCSQGVPSISKGAATDRASRSTTSLLSAFSYASSSPSMLLSSQHSSSSPRGGTDDGGGGGNNIPAVSDEEGISRGGRGEAVEHEEASSAGGVSSSVASVRSVRDSSSSTSSQLPLPTSQSPETAPGNNRGSSGVTKSVKVTSKGSCGDLPGAPPQGTTGEGVAGGAAPGVISSSGGGEEASPATDAEGFLIPDPLPLPSAPSGSAGSAHRIDQKKDEPTRRRRSGSPQNSTAGSQPQTPSVVQAASLNGISSSSLQALASSFTTSPSSVPPSLQTLVSNTFPAHSPGPLTSASLSSSPQSSPFQGVGAAPSFPTGTAALAASALPTAPPLSTSPQPPLVNVSSNLLNLAASGVVSSPSAAALLSAALARTAPGAGFPFSSPLLVQKPSFAATSRPFPAQTLTSFVPPTSLVAAALKNASPAFSLQSLQQLQQTRFLSPHLDPTVLTPQSHPSLRAGSINPNTLFSTHQAAASSPAGLVAGGSNLLVTPSGGLIKSNAVLGAPLLSPLSPCQSPTITTGVPAGASGQISPHLATKTEPGSRGAHNNTDLGTKVAMDEKTPPVGTTFPGEEDGVCSVCVVGECEQQNNIVFCDGCGCAVHQFCYGVVEIPEGPWYCSLCTWLRKSRKTGTEVLRGGSSGENGGSTSSGSSQQGASHLSTVGTNTERENSKASAPDAGGEEGKERDVALEASSITCRLCGKSGGAMRRGPEKLWVHSCCVLFCRSGPQFRKTLQLDEPVDIRASLAVARAMGWRCTICSKREGYPIPCGFRGCQSRVHVTCAREKRCVCVITSLWEGESEGVGRERVWKAVFCPLHNDLRSIELAKQFEREKLFSSLSQGGGGRRRDRGHTVNRNTDDG